jgi:L-alanine-DL-glutamate epimerase-like enolase superfamily enzyme
MLTLDVEIEHWELHEVFATSRDAITHIPVITATLTDATGRRGRGEAAGVDYDGETPEGMRATLRSVRAQLHDDLTTTEVARLLAAGGARNALDCALWDLRAKQSGIPAWRSAGLPRLTAVDTCMTIGLGSEADTRRKARAVSNLPLIKIKVNHDWAVDPIRIVREEAPNSILIVDANQAWSRELLERLLPAMHALDVRLIEQPVARGEDRTLAGLDSPIALAADESCTDRGSLASLRGLYTFVNIKLDKCGGLTEALAVAREARAMGFGLMVGNMCGTSLEMAPAFLIAQWCTYTDLDGPLLQKLDRPHPIRTDGAIMQPPEPTLWG